MGMTWKIIKNKFPKMKAAVKNLSGRGVSVGATGEQAYIAGIHEYGCRIKVTEKMRAWFAYQGYPLKKSTQVIVIPERSFLRNGFDEHAVGVVEKYDPLLGKVLGGEANGELLLQGIGLELASKIKSYARKLSKPPNTEMTKERKGTSNPLIGSGGMIESISYEVE